MNLKKGMLIGIFAVAAAFTVGCTTGTSAYEGSALSCPQAVYAVKAAQHDPRYAADAAKYEAQHCATQTQQSNDMPESGAVDAATLFSIMSQ